MGAEISSEIIVITCRSAQCHITQDYDLKIFFNVNCLFFLGVKDQF